MTAGLRMTPEQYADFVRKRAAAPPVATLAPAATPTPAKPAEAVKSLSAEETKVLRAHRSKQAFQALGRLPKGRMNKTEREYADLLEERKRIGQVLWWKFHPFNVRLPTTRFMRSTSSCSLRTGISKSTRRRARGPRTIRK
jgi:hypothetical protein